MYFYEEKKEKTLVTVELHDLINPFNQESKLYNVLLIVNKADQLRHVWNLKFTPEMMSWSCDAVEVVMEGKHLAGGSASYLNYHTHT